MNYMPIMRAVSVFRSLCAISRYRDKIVFYEEEIKKSLYRDNYISNNYYTAL